jgi:hypothetical protein
VPRELVVSLDELHRRTAEVVARCEAGEMAKVIDARRCRCEPGRCECPGRVEIRAPRMILSMQDAIAEIRSAPVHDLPGFDDALAEGIATGALVATLRADGALCFELTGAGRRMALSLGKGTG